MTTFLKFAHLAAIAVWSGGLLALPLLFVQRRHVADGVELVRLHRITRLVFVELASPAAFIAIASGTALIFVQTTFQEWFTLKMVLVGLMAMLHVVAGLVMHGLFTPGGRFGRVAFSTLWSAYLVLICAIVWIVLAKPQIDSNMIAAHLFEPGALQRLLR